MKIDEIEISLHAYGAMRERYLKLLKFVKELADESVVYEKYENLNELNWCAFDLLKKVGEDL